MPPMSRNHPLLPLGIAVPLIYFGTLFAAASTWSEYSHVTQYASELGSADAPQPWIFNRGIILMGAVTLFAALGFGATLARLTRRAGWSVGAGVLFALFGVSMIMGGLFPMPNPLHGGFGLALALPFVPVCAAIALSRTREASGLRAFLWTSAVLMVIVLAIMMGVGQLVRRSNVGLWQRVNALTMFPWMAVAAPWLGAIAGRPGVGARR